MSETALERARREDADTCTKCDGNPHAREESDYSYSCEPHHTAIASLEAAAGEDERKKWTEFFGTDKTAQPFRLDQCLAAARLAGRLEQAERAVRLANAGRHSVEDLKEELDRLRRDGEKG